VQKYASRLLVLGLAAIPDWFEAWALENGIDYASCEDAAYNRADPGSRVGGVGHPNAQVHRHWARCSLRALAERGLVTTVDDHSSPKIVVPWNQ
jgi:hypothetical protein